MKSVIKVIVMMCVCLPNHRHPVLAQTTPPKVEMKLVLANQKVQAGRLITAALMVDIPTGYHMNAHEPISSFALPTQIEVKLPEGYKLGTISYPRAVVRKFTFSEDRLGVYERHTVIKFSFRIPSTVPRGTTTLRAILNYQSCSDEVCFPPKKQEASVGLEIT